MRLNEENTSVPRALKREREREKNENAAPCVFARLLAIFLRKRA